MGLRFAAAIFAFSAGAFAATAENSIADVIAIVRTAVREKRSDNQLAKALHKLKLVECLDQHTVEELESEGAGPKSVEELLRMRDESVANPAPTGLSPFAAPPMPDRSEQVQLVHDATRYALAYSASLPDFICNQTVQRYEALEPKPSWNLKDVLVVKLTYFDGLENYRLLSLKGRQTNRSWESLGGAISKGEFASMLLTIFQLSAHTKFRWDHWTHLRNRLTHVYRFAVLPENSPYRLDFGMGGMRASTNAGQHGDVYIDNETHKVVRIYDEADNIAPDFPVRQATRMLDYDFIAVGEKKFLLPLRVDVRMGTDRLHTKNEVQFHSYRKFTGESTITFDVTPDKN